MRNRKQGFIHRKTQLQYAHPLILVLFGRVFVHSLAILHGSRKKFLRGVGLIITGTWVPNDCASANGRNQIETLSSKLVSIIPIMEFGAPATNATIPSELSGEIESMVSLMEREAINTKDNAVSNKLSGSWRLLYSNAPEIVSLSKGLPLGFQLGPTCQPLDTSRGWFENRAKIGHPYHIAALQSIVLGSIEPGRLGSLNAIGVENEDNNRVTIKFERILFQLDEVVGTTLKGPIRKTLIPSNSSVTGNPTYNNQEGSKSPNERLPANDQTYLDDLVRIVRGGDGSLFVFVRSLGDNETCSSRMMTPEERDTIINSFQNHPTERRKSRPFSLMEPTPLGNEIQNTSIDPVPIEIEYLFPERSKSRR